MNFMSNGKKTRIYAIVGATASGKSALALELAQKYGGEIVCCDSMQIYRRMDIGTAKPTQSEREQVAHHMIDIVEPTEAFSCADYVSAAQKVIADISARGKLSILCGGTGLYLDALLRPTDFKEGTTDDSLRAELLGYARVHGAVALHDMLREIDEASAEQIHPNNVKRVARAIEICRLSGVPKSQLDAQSRLGEGRYDIRCVCLDYSDRALLYEHIEKRVDIMLAEGLEAETRALIAEGVFEKNATAAQAIGYKELFGYIGGTQTLTEATENLKAATRRYAKRQITWFARKDYITHIDVCDGGKTKIFKDIVNNASKVFFC